MNNSKTILVIFLFSLCFINVSPDEYHGDDENYDQIDHLQAPYDYLPAPDCPLENEKYLSKCNPNTRYRTVDGSCNNLLNPWWGAVNTPYKRYLKSAYDDGFRSPRTFSKKHGTFLANSRLLTDKLLARRPTFTNKSSAVMFFGQYITHDFALTIPTTTSCSCYSKSNECFNIVIPIEDKHFNETECLPFQRSADARTFFNCDLNQREQATGNSHWLDCNNLYGTTAEQTKRLRKFKGGLLLSSRVPGSPFESLPIKNKTICMDTTKKTAGCFFAGDERFDQHVMLTEMHVIFLRLHNKYARELSIINPRWSDETIFQETRRILIAINAQIIYSEWLPIIIGDKLMKQFALYPLTEGYLMNYNENIYPQLSNEFVTAAQRLHIFIHRTLEIADKFLNQIDQPLLYEDTFFSQSVSYFHGDAWGRGNLLGTTYRHNMQLADALNHKLFQDFPNLGDHSSLGALNIQRGRDHGVGGYNMYRKFCGFKFAKSFDDFNDTITNPANLALLKTHYKHHDDVDLYIGLSAESPVGGSLVGPTSGCILARQYYDLKYGDRHFYENGNNPRTRFTKEQLNELRHYTFARAFCDAFGLFKVQRQAFFRFNEDSNPYVRCSDIPDIDLRWWASKKY